MFLFFMSSVFYVLFYSYIFAFSYLFILHLLPLCLLVSQGSCSEVPQTTQICCQQSGGQTSKTNVSAGLISSEGFEGRICPRSLSQLLMVCWQVLAFLGSQKHHLISAFMFIWSYPYVYVSLSRICLFIRKWVLMYQGPTLSRKAFSFSFLSSFLFFVYQVERQLLF